jgi:hypothetical protein
MTKLYTIQIEFDNREGDFYIPLPEELLSSLGAMGWSINDELEFIDNEDGTFTVKKKEQE